LLLLLLLLLLLRLLLLLLLLLLVQDFGLHKFAADFADAGLAAFVFDYRGWGGSGGARRTHTHTDNGAPVSPAASMLHHTTVSPCPHTQPHAQVYAAPSRPSGRSAAAAPGRSDTDSMFPHRAPHLQPCSEKPGAVK
jgi:hypothetical protein